jgi:hypothetical protein
MSSLSFRKVFPLLGAGLLLSALSALYAAQTCPAAPTDKPAMGVVESIDAKAKTFVLQPGGPGFEGMHHRDGGPGGAPGAPEETRQGAPEMTQAPEPIVVSASGAKFFTEKEGAFTDCAVGKWARILQHPNRQGEVTAAAMVTLLAEAPPAPPQPKGEGWGPQAGPEGRGPGVRGKGFRGGEAGPIVKLNPFTIKLPDGTAMEVTLSDQTRFVKTVAGTFSDIGEGKRVMVTGKKLEDGSINAARVVVQLEHQNREGRFGPRSGEEAPPK